MNTSQIIVAFAVVGFVILSVLVVVFRKNRMTYKVNPLIGFAFAFIIAGVVFWKEGLVGYGLFAIGVVLAVVDIFNQSRTR